MTVLHVNHRGLFTFCWLATTARVIYLFFHFAPSTYLSLSLSWLGRRHRFGGAVVRPPSEALEATVGGAAVGPCEGSALEATVEGGGLISNVVLYPHICCLAALSRQRGLRR